MSSRFDGDALLAEAGRLAAAPPQATAEELELLTFGVGGEMYALRLLEVSEVAKVPPLMPVPGLPATLLGAVNLRGEVIAVADLSALLGFGPAPPGPSARLVVVRSNAERVGLFVDRIGDLERGSPTERPAGAGDLLKAQALLPGGRLVALLDLPKVLDALAKG